MCCLGVFAVKVLGRIPKLNEQYVYEDIDEMFKDAYEAAYLAYPDEYDSDIDGFCSIFVELNDNKRYTFRQIADYIEKHWSL